VAAGGEDGRVDATPEAEPAVVGEERGGGVGRGAAQEDTHHLLLHQRAVHEDAVRPRGRHGRRRRHQGSGSRPAVACRSGAGRSHEEEDDDGDSDRPPCRLNLLGPRLCLNWVSSARKIGLGCAKGHKILKIKQVMNVAGWAVQKDIKF
jgi:hypothetical protein